MVSHDHHCRTRVRRPGVGFLTAGRNQGRLHYAQYHVARPAKASSELAAIEACAGVWRWGIEVPLEGSARMSFGEPAVNNGGGGKDDASSSKH